MTKTFEGKCFNLVTQMTDSFDQTQIKVVWKNSVSEYWGLIKNQSYLCYFHSKQLVCNPSQFKSELCAPNFKEHVCPCIQNESTELLTSRKELILWTKIASKKLM